MKQSRVVGFRKSASQFAGWNRTELKGVTWAYETVP